LVSRFSINTSCDGEALPPPSARAKTEWPVESVAVVTLKLLSVAVLAKVNPMFLLSDVAMVLP
jgi:hypothetical protein